MILVDSSVLIDVIECQPEWVEWSVERLHDCSKEDSLAINIIIYSEISRSFRNAVARGQNQTDGDLKTGSLRRE
jgi:predicted nucleic acid-binding protein